VETVQKAAASYSNVAMGQSTVSLKTPIGLSRILAIDFCLWQAKDFDGALDAFENLCVQH